MEPVAPLLVGRNMGHSERKHSLCSASGAERWLNCPGSVGLSLQVPEEPSSPAAQEGTRAHELAEKIMRRWEENGRKLDDGYISFLRSEYEDTEHEISDGRVWSMVDYALTYCHACIDEVEAFDKDSEVAVRLEHRLTFNSDMNMHGTADFFATGVRGGRGYGVICDLKYGKKKVKTEGNAQLAYYSCALKAMSKKNLETVKVRVVQPRIGHWFSDVEYSAQELEQWKETLTLGAEKALLQIGWKEPTLQTGPWCWFCPARSICPEKIKAAQQEAVAAFAEDPL